jgi:hypothetical protein
MHELFQRIHPNARARHCLPRRLAAALAMPRATNYVAPPLRLVDAIVYAFRGYDVSWSRPTHTPGDLNPSGLQYEVYAFAPGEAMGIPSHGVEVRTVFPGWAHRAICDARNAMGRWRARRIGKAAEVRK